jgi:hypothetical protein
MLMHREELAPNLKEYYVRYRFGDGSRESKNAKLDHPLRTSFEGNPQLVVVHEPYPKQAQEGSFENREAVETPFGEGVGITALLEAYAKRAGQFRECVVWAFLNNRRLGEAQARNFFDACLRAPGTSRSG